MNLDINEALRSIFDNAVDAICLHQAGRHVVVNSAYRRLFGFDDGFDLSRLPLLEMVAPSHRAEVAERIRRRQAGESLHDQYLVRGRRADGSEFDLDIHSTACRVDDTTLSLVIMRDVTEDLAAAARMHESEGRMRAMFESSPDPTWIIQNNRFVECNAAAVACLGYDSREQVLNLHPSQLSPPVQPDGQDSFVKAEAMMRETADKGILRFEWLHRRADGSEFPAEVTLSEVILQGEPSLYCVWRDIATRKRAEAELRLAASVFHTSQEGIVITDRDGIILSVNPAFTTITGYSAAEAVGQTPRMLKSNHHDAAFYAAMWQSILEDGAWQGEVWNRRKNGEAYLESLTITAILDGEGAHTRFVSVFSDITEIRRKDEQIRHQAYHDALTGLPNRVLLLDRLGHAIEVGSRRNEPVAVLFLDLDRFKVVNDSLGHQEGDKLLQITARRLQDSVRKSDTVGRLGGDEFIIILSRFEDASEVAQVAEKVIATLAQPVELSGHPIQTGTSIGIAVYPQDGDDAHVLMKNADVAMYQAKSAGRGAFRFFDASMNMRAVERLETEAALRRAVARQEFEVYYQPKIHSPTEQLCGAEALIRWRLPDGGMVAPDQFIPLAEETGLIIPLGYWVLEEVCRQLARWRADGLPPVAVSVNLSPRQFADPALAGRVSAILAAAGVEPALIEIELTETTVMQNPAEAIRTLRALQDLGLRVSVDDFGTGYSSLAYLKRFPISTIKIDRSFVADLGTDPDDAAIIGAIITLAGSLRLEVVAEGVETSQQLSMVSELGCDVVQGYYYGKPVPAVDFRAWLTKLSGG